MPGHKLTLSVCTSMWPYVLMPSSDTKVKISKASLTLPCLVDPKPVQDDEPFSLYKTPRFGIPMKTSLVEKSTFKRSIEVDLTSKTVATKTKADDGLEYNHELDIIQGEDLDTSYTILDVDEPFATVSSCKRVAKVVYNASKKATEALIKATTELKVQGDEMVLDESIYITLDGEEFFNKDYSSKITRKFI